MTNDLQATCVGDMLDARRHVWTATIGPNMEAAIGFIRTRYANAEALDCAFRFVREHLAFIARGDDETVQRFWFKPWFQVCDELESALTAALLAQHRYAADSMRRALELTVVGLHLTSNDVPESKARLWLDATEPTPRFGACVKSLRRQPRFAEAAAEFGWDLDLSALYSELSDILHVRGEPNMSRHVDPSAMNLNGVSVPKYSEDHLTRSLHRLLDCIGLIAFTHGLANPIIFRGLPLWQKYGVEGPASGFLEEEAAEMLLSIIPKKMLPFANRLASTDEEVLSLIEWIEGLPDRSVKAWSQSGGTAVPRDNTTLRDTYAARDARLSENPCEPTRAGDRDGCTRPPRRNTRAP